MTDRVLPVWLGCCGDKRPVGVYKLGERQRGRDGGRRATVNRERREGEGEGRGEENKENERRGKKKKREDETNETKAVVRAGDAASKRNTKRSRVRERESVGEDSARTSYISLSISRLSGEEWIAIAIREAYVGLCIARNPSSAGTLATGHLCWSCNANPGVEQGRGPGGGTRGASGEKKEREGDISVDVDSDS